MKRWKSFLASLTMMLLLWGGVVFMGCSSDDDISEPTHTESPDGNKPTGGEPTGGETTGGETTGGNTTGGETTGGETTGGETTGGNTTGGETTGGETTGGETTGGEEITKVPLFTVVGLCGTEVVPMTIPEGGDGTEQYLTFVYAQDTTIKGLDGKDKALKDGWGGIANPQLKIVPQTALSDNNTPNWTMDYAGPYNESIYVMPGKDWIKLSYRSKDNSNPGNIYLDGLIPDEEYTLCVKFDAESNRMDFKVLGRSVDVPGMQIVVSTGTGEPFSIPMTRTGTTYTYEFIAAQTLNLSYYFKCPFLNAVYYGEGKELVKIGNTDDVSTKLNTLSIVKSYKYTIKIKAGDILFGDNGTFAGFDGKTSWNVEKGPPILWTGVLLWENTNDTAYFGNGSYTFVAKGTSVGFKLLRDDSDTMAWGGVNITPGKTTTLTYKTTLVPDENGFAYTVPEEKKSASNEVEYIKAESLTEGKGYKVSFADIDADHDKFEICLVELPLVDLSSPMLGINGDFNGWGHTDFIIEDGIGIAEFVATATEHQIQIAAEGWNPQYGNGNDIIVDGDELTGIVGSSNMIITGCVIGTTYQVICKPNYGAVDVKIVTKK